jgi:acyl-CoA dehydrogenase
MSVDQLLVETVDRVLTNACTHEEREDVQAHGWSPSVWEALAGLGLPWVGVSEEIGGSGGSLLDAVAVLRAVGYHAAPVPVAESILAGWLLGAVGMPMPERPVTVVPDPAGLRFDGTTLFGAATKVPWARVADWIVVLVDGHVLVAPTNDHRVRIRHEANLAGEARDLVHFDGPRLGGVLPAPSGIDMGGLRLRGMLTRVALMAGALEAMAVLTASYTSERHQFGKPVGSFQAVQALVVRAAEEAVLTDVALQTAARAAERGPAAFEITAAKIVANASSRAATRAAHQAHGAIGMTREYDLHHLSRRLWAWRAEYEDAGLAARFGRTVAGEGADALYRIVADGSAAIGTTTVTDSGAV